LKRVMGLELQKLSHSIDGGLSSTSPSSSL
jgi:hypothetical protein